jgi:hypothetical protein
MPWPRNALAKMDPKLGPTLGYLGTSVLKAIETSDVEQRLAKLENANEHVASVTACGYRLAQRQACC